MPYRCHKHFKSMSIELKKLKTCNIQIFLGNEQTYQSTFERNNLQCLKRIGQFCHTNKYSILICIFWLYYHKSISLEGIKSREIKCDKKAFYFLPTHFNQPDWCSGHINPQLWLNT